MVLRFRREHYKSLSHQRLRGEADDAIERKSRRPGLLVKSGQDQNQNAPVPEACSCRAAMSLHGPFRQILQRKQMSAFRVITEVAAGYVKRRS
jgi:hypothetical protein